MGKVSKALNKAESIFETGNSQRSSLHETRSTIHTRAENRNKAKREQKTAPPSTQTQPSIENWDERLVQTIERFSAVAENFRKLRTAILHPESGRPPRSIMVLSSDPQEGKSFVCANLGVCFAQSVGHQALMIDCDLRRPTLHNIFGLKLKKGLTNYLQGEDNLSDLIVSTGHAKLSFIPSGPPPENPSELLSSNKMPAMMEELADKHDDRLILIDTPPFHAASEALVLSQLVDKIVLVVRWGKSGREDVKKMIDIIGREKITGVVFNAFETNIIDRKVQGVGYHNYYHEPY